MTLPESEKQKIIDIVGRFTDVYRKEFNVRIFTVRNTNGSLTLIMGDEHIKVDITYTLQDFEYIGRYIMRNHPGELAFYFGIYWQNELHELYSVYCKKLKQKAIRIIDNCCSDLI
jgi:hypothetical protein